MLEEEPHYEKASSDLRIARQASGRCSRENFGQGVIARAVVGVGEAILVVAEEIRRLTENYERANKA